MLMWVMRSESESHAVSHSWGTHVNWLKSMSVYVCLTWMKRVTHIKEAHDSLEWVFWGVLQCVAVWFSAPQCVAVWYSVLHVCCSVIECVAVCCSVLLAYSPVLGCSRFLRRCKRVFCSSVLQCVAVRCTVAACCSVLQCVAVCCGVLQCAACVISSAKDAQDSADAANALFHSFECFMSQITMRHVAHLNT